jgi:hypothetical protein
MIAEDKIWINENWIHVDGVGVIGRYLKDRKEIGLDWSMILIVGTNDPIPCSESHSDIKKAVAKLF